MRKSIEANMQFKYRLQQEMGHETVISEDYVLFT